ncbi:MAG: histidine phosphatase family protein [Actinomycetes bacterium]
MSDQTIVHLLRHGEVHNPGKVLYGRLPDFHLSELGRAMADKVATAIGERDIVLVVASPLERAQETAAPLAARRSLEIATDPNLIEADNVFEGKQVSVGDGVLRQPKYWRHLVNPFRPSWGEPYVEVAARMRAAITAAREQAHGHEAVLVSHQLPVWIARLDAEQRRFFHDPRHRQCTLASLTSLTFDGNDLVAITYSEPAAALLPGSSKIAGA